MRIITKASGQKESFDIKKFKRSLLRSGVSEKIIEELVQEIIRRTDLKTTSDIYRYAFNALVSQRSPAAARYNLKKALYDLGPSGFPLEKFLAKLFEEQGYNVFLNQIAPGKCISYEIDLVLKKENKYHFVESKFHIRQGRKSDIQPVLYSKARFDDIQAYYMQKPMYKKKNHLALVITNTKFTSKAIQYAECVGMKLIDWSYPQEGSLAVLIDRLGIHPITALSTLSSNQKRRLIEKNIVLCREIKKNIDKLKEVGISQHRINRIVKEAEEMRKIRRLER